MTDKNYQLAYYHANKERINKQRKEKRTGKPASSHTVASPSALHRLMRCPGSAVLCKSVPEQSSKYAEEGTLFHSVMEYILKSKLGEQVTNKWVRMYIETYSTIALEKEAIDEMVDCVQGAIEWFNLNFVNANQIIAETRLPMYYSDKDFGTADVIILFDDRLVIVDWKYGKGVDVSPNNNPQLISYAVSALKYLSSQHIDIRKFKEIETIIYQPRIYTGDTVKSYKYTMQELVQQSKIIKEAVDKVYALYSKSVNSKIVKENLSASDEACKFCPAKMICKAYAKQGTELLSDLISEKEKLQKHPDDVNWVEIGKKFEEELPKLQQFFNDVLEYFLVLPAEERPQGVYESRKSGRLSYINNQEKVIEVLRNNEIDAIDHSIKLITLTELKKQLKKLENKDEILKEITEKREGSKYITFNPKNCNLLDDIDL